MHSFWRCLRLLVLRPFGIACICISSDATAEARRETDKPAEAIVDSDDQSLRMAKQNLDKATLERFVNTGTPEQQQMAKRWLVAIERMAPHSGKTYPTMCQIIEVGEKTLKIFIHSRALVLTVTKCGGNLELDVFRKPLIEFDTSLKSGDKADVLFIIPTNMEYMLERVGAFRVVGGFIYDPTGVFTVPTPLSIVKRESEAETQAALSRLSGQAEQGDAQAQFSLWETYYQGVDAPKDVKKAIGWLLQAAEQGHADAQAVLGSLHDGGIAGVKKDGKEAFKWYSKAAEQGHAEAQMHLVRFYRQGVSVQKDEDKAVEWLTKAAEQGHTRAQLTLGALYRKGVMVPVDEEKSIEWTRRAAKQDNAYGDMAKRILEGLVPQLRE